MVRQSVTVVVGPMPAGNSLEPEAYPVARELLDVSGVDLSRLEVGESEGVLCVLNVVIVIVDAAIGKSLITLRSDVCTSLWYILKTCFVTRLYLCSC
jgi:hypothetical protein